MFEGINRALVFLYEHKKINEQQLRALQIYYRNIQPDSDLNVIKNELNELFNNSNYVNVILSKDSLNNNSNLDNNVTSQQDPVQEEKKRELVNVYDFSRGEQSYIKLTYSDGTVRILENNLVNNGQPCKGENYFSVLKEKYSDHDITRLFHEFTRDSIEIKLHDFKDLSNKNYYDQLPQESQKLINIVMSNYPDKKVLSGPESNIFVVCEYGKPDILVQVETLNGVYQVRPIIGNTVGEENLTGDSSNDVFDSKRKLITRSTLIGKAFADKEAGFMTLLLFIFLAGISSGIIFMIILNFIA